MEIFVPEFVVITVSIALSIILPVVPILFIRKIN
ncbi:MAG: hypothetical protein K0R55_2086 [Sporomusa sp.]|jgi:hypothetical protein|nr:hypothetical protein [Sporomusa sp.]